MTNLVWALIVVSGAANVSFSSGYPSQALCEDAISIARTGMTVDEKKSSDEAAKVVEDRAEQEFQASHPSRIPTAEDKLNCGKISKTSWIMVGGQSNCVIDTDKNLTIFSRRYLVTTTMSAINDPSREIRYAKCVLVDPEDKK